MLIRLSRVEVIRLTMTTKEITWNLTALFQSTADPAVQKTMAELVKEAETFSSKYKGKIKALPPCDLAKCLGEYEQFLARLYDVTLFSSLSFYANMTLPETQALYDKSTKAEAKLGKQFAFFDLELGSRVSADPQTINDPDLAKYRHFMERLQRKAAHLLSETEEQLIIEKDQFGVTAWQELQNKWLNTRTFEVEVEGKKKLLSYGDANGLLPHQDRATRESANKSIYGLLGQSAEIFASALRSICNDWMSICERRKYESPMHASLISNDIDQKTIDNLLEAVERNATLYRRYLHLKAKLMKLPKLGCHDIIAPLPDLPEMKYDYEAAKDLALDAYSEFSDGYAFAVRDMYAKNHIDASPRFGKRNGAFCSDWYNGKSAFILSSFSGALKDIYTLAHELGHATHDYYYERSQSILNTNVPMIVAETASTFGELLLTDSMLNKAKSEREKIPILCAILDEAGMTIFQVTARVWFEQSLYDAIRQGKYLDHNTICQYWTNARDRIYGGSVEWFREMEAEWTMKPHYYMANFRFYNYPYVYAQLFVYALYEKYLQEGKDFVPKFIKALSAGSSVSPAEIGKICGLDIGSPAFWELGLKRFEFFVNELEKIAK